MKEVWKVIECFTAYEVSNMGRVRKIHPSKNIKGDYAKTGLLKAQPLKGGYMSVGLYKNGKFNSKTVHRLVAIAFLINPSNKQQVNHIDCNPSNNKLSNLEWVTPIENVHHSMKHGHFDRCIKRGEDNHLSKLKEHEVLEIRDKYKGEISKNKLADEYNVNKRLIDFIVQRKIWKHI